MCNVSDSLQCSESSLRRTAQLGLITLKMKVLYSIVCMCVCVCVCVHVCYASCNYCTLYVLLVYSNLWSTTIVIIVLLFVAILF